MIKYIFLNCLPVKDEYSSVILCDGVIPVPFLGELSIVRLLEITTSQTEKETPP